MQTLCALTYSANRTFPSNISISNSSLLSWSYGWSLMCCVCLLLFYIYEWSSINVLFVYCYAVSKSDHQLMCCVYFSLKTTLRCFSMTGVWEYQRKAPTAMHPSAYLKRSRNTSSFSGTWLEKWASTISQSSIMSECRNTNFVFYWTTDGLSYYILCSYLLVYICNVNCTCQWCHIEKKNYLILICDVARE